MTLALLWQEYKTEHPEGLQYSQFCERYRAWRRRLDVVMRQTHRAGERLFVDYAGQCVPVVSRETGELRNAQVFVAVLGASSYTFAEATWTQALPDWCASHVRALSFLQGVPEIVVPDNLRSAVSRPHRYEPDAHPTYTDLAEHYGFAIVPARVRRPRDKAKAEVGVQVVERWILAALRHRTFFSLAELNEAIAERLDGSTHARSASSPARDAAPSSPSTARRYARCPPSPTSSPSGRRCACTSTITSNSNATTTPSLTPSSGRQLHARYTERTVELFHRGQRVASHVRSHMPGRHTTVAEHMPEKHRRFAQQWSPSASRDGPRPSDPPPPRSSPRCSTPGATPSKATAPASASCAWPRPTPTPDSKPPPSAPSPSAPARCARSSPILKHRLDETPLDEASESPLPDDHDNLRGPSYFH